MSTLEAFEILLTASTPLNLVDVGARWGANPRWDTLSGNASVICFEPDPEECRRLKQSAPSHIRYLPYGLADQTCSRTLYVTQEPACSSIYPPISSLHRHYPPLSIIEPVRAIDIICQKFDEIASIEGLNSVDAMKLDTQGSELSILRGAEYALETICLIDIEVEFNPIYEDQNLFCDVDRFLRDRGFVLWRLENLVHYSSENIPAAETKISISNDPRCDIVQTPGGQIFWAQAQYVKAKYPRTSELPIPENEAKRAALLAAVYGFWDLAIEITRKMPTEDLHNLLKSRL